MNRPRSEQRHQTLLCKLANLALQAGCSNSAQRQQLRNGQRRGKRHARFQLHKLHRHWR